MAKLHSKNTQKNKFIIQCIIAFNLVMLVIYVYFIRSNEQENVNEPVGETVSVELSIDDKEPVTEVTPEPDKEPVIEPETEAVTEPVEEPSGDNYSIDDFNGYLGNDPAMQNHPKAPDRPWIENLYVPEYSGEAYISLNAGNPFFDTANIDATPWEMYYDLDDLGRCTLAEGVFGKETMPTEKRGSISAIKPTGWHSSKYPQELVDGQSLYNRCHLVAFGLSGETANKYNLVTGTRYFNTDGINAYENMMIDYIRETGNHVRYRVTPVFTGDNLICDGQVVEGWSIEDNGDGICFCIYSYNVQPGVYIDYLTGDNHAL